MKKKYSFIFGALLFVTVSVAQTVNIPDPVLKQILLGYLDENENGEIDITNDEHIYSGFVVINNALVTDLSGLSELDIFQFDIRNTGASSLNLSGNQFISNVLLTNNALLQSVDVSNSLISSIVIEHSPLLTTLNLQGCLTLDTFIVTNTGLQSIDISALTDVEHISCSANAQLVSFKSNSTFGPMATYEVHHNPNLVEVDMMDTQGNSFRLDHNNLAQLTVNSFQELNAQNNALTEITLVGSSEMAFLDVSGNQLTELDLSRCTSFYDVRASNNQLIRVNFKNGHLDYHGDFTGNPDLAFVCADAFESTYIAETIALSEGVIPVVNDYCNFTPGGSHNTIAGSFSFDVAGDGCDASDIRFPNAKFKVTNGDATEAVFANADGEFSFFVNNGTYVLSPDFEAVPFFSAPPVNAVFANANDTTFEHHFCVTANGVHPDAEIVLNGSMPEPGFDTNYTVTLRNKGNQFLSGTASVTFDDTRLDYISSAPAATADAGSVSWNYTNLQPFETRTYSFILNVNSPMETPAVNIGDVLSFTASATVPSDETPTDNTFAFSQEVFGSYDPNDVTCLQGEIVSPTKIGEYLHYLIRFENTGNASAHNIVVKNVIDQTKFDVSSLQILQSSDDMVTRVTGNKAEFIFEGIELGAAQHGHVLYKIRTLPTLVENAAVMASADIFFDYNFPVTTNGAETVFQQLSVGEVSDVSISVFPNPTADVVTVRAHSDLRSIALFDIQGRLLMTKKVGSNVASVDISDETSGVYFIKVRSAKGSSVTKVVKK